jgi:hypothetical protein
MDMFFGVLSILGFCIFLIWIFHSAIFRNKKKIPTTEPILSTVVFIICLSILTSGCGKISGTSESAAAKHSNKKNTTEKDVIDQLKNAIDRNIIGMEKGNNYSVEIKKLEAGGYSAVIQLQAYSTSDGSIDTAEGIIRDLIEYRLSDFQKLDSLTFKFIDDSSNSVKFTVEAKNTKLINSKDNIRNNLILRDDKGKEVKIASKDKPEKEKTEEGKTNNSSQDFKKGMEAYNNKDYQKAMDYFIKVDFSDPNFNKAIDYAAKAYGKLQITNETIRNKGTWYLDKWYTVDDINYKINSIKAMKSLRGYKPASGNVLLVLDLTIKNMTGEPGYSPSQNLSINSKFNFILCDSENYRYNDLQISSHTLNGVLSTRSEMRGELVYEIPIKVGDIVFEAVMNNFNYKTAVLLK